MIDFKSEVLKIKDQMIEDIKKLCAMMRKEGIDWLIKLFCELTAAFFRCREHINQRNLQNIAA